MNTSAIIANAYHDFALNEKANMLKVAELLENFRGQVNEKKPFETWENLKIDLTNNETLIPGFIDLFRKYYSAIYRDFVEKITQSLKKNKEEGLAEWLRAYADGIIYYRSEFKIPLCEESFSFPENFLPELEEYKKLNRWILESRWMDAYPILEKFSLKKELTTFQQSCLQILLGLIELYYFSDWQQSANRFKSAKELYPENQRIERAEVEYLVYDKKISEAKNKLLALITKYPDLYINYNLLGNCYKEEANLTAAEQWYYDAIRVHSLQTESWSSLIQLYSEKKWYAEKKEMTSALIQKIKELEVFSDYDNELYNAYRDQAYGASVNEDHENAQNIYDTAILLKPNFITAIIDNANHCIRNNDLLKAEELLKFAEKNDKKCFDVYWGLAYLYELKEDKINEALSAYKECLVLRPAWADQVYNFMANLYSRQNDFEKAIECYNNAIELNPLNTIYKENIGGLAEKIINSIDNKLNAERTDQLIDISAALITDKDALNRIGNYYYRNKNFEKALNFYDRALEKDDKVSVFYENKGLASEMLNQFDLAEKNYIKACELEKDSGEPFNTLGYFYFLKGKLEEASVNYLKALEKDGKNETYLQNLIRSYGDAGKYDLAEEWNRKLVELNKENADHVAQLAYYLSVQNKNDEALTTIQQAYGIDNKNIYVLKTMGSVYEKSNQTEKAFSLYNDIIKQYPGEDSILNRIGVLYFRNGDYTNAIEYYSKAIEVNNKTGVYFDNLGLAYESSGDLLKAQESYNQFVKLDPQNSEALNNLAVVQYKMSKNAEAEKNYLAALEIDPQNPVFLENLALLYRTMKLNDKAIEYFEKNLKLKPDNHVNHNDVGVLYFITDNNEKAIEHYQEAIKQKPDIFLYYENLGLAYKNMGLRNDEKKAYETALSYDPINARLLNRLGVWYYEEKDHNSAIDYYYKAIAIEDNNPTFFENLALALYADGDDSNDDEAIEAYNKHLKLSPENFSAWNELGILYFKKGMYKEAIGAYKQADRIKPGSAVIFANKGLAFEALNKYDEAEKNYLAALEIDPQNASYYENLAILYRTMQLNNKAIEYFEKYLKLKPDNHIYQNDVGVLYFIMANNEKAIEHYNEAIKQKPDSFIYYENLGLAYKNMGQRLDERKAYETALANDPANARLLNRLGVWYYEEKDHRSAIDYYHKTIAIEDNNPTYFENLALALYTDGDESNDDEAIDVYNKLLKLSPDNFSAWNELGILYFKKGMHKEAIEAYEQADKVKPGSAIIYDNIGTSYLAQEKYKEASDYFLKALDAGSSNNVRILQNLGDIYHLKLEKSKEAISFYSKALAIQPDAITWKYLAEAYEAINDVRNATKAKEEWKRLTATESQ